MLVGLIPVSNTDNDGNILDTAHLRDFEAVFAVDQQRRPVPSDVDIDLLKLLHNRPGVVPHKITRRNFKHLAGLLVPILRMQLK